MATPKTNKNCRYVQNDPHKCKIKLEKFHFDILCRFGVIRKVYRGVSSKSRIFDFNVFSIIHLNGHNL